MRQFTKPHSFGPPRALATFSNGIAKEDFIFSGQPLCRPSVLKAAEMLGFCRVTRNVGFVTCVTLSRSSRADG
jgi:hypothetical protein